MIIILNILIIAIIVFIVCWFYLYQPKAVHFAESGEVTISVEDGAYKPEYITAYAGQPLVIHFQLKDDVRCADTVLFPDFNVSAELSKRQTTHVTLLPDKTGKFTFACPLLMYRGTLEVKPVPAIDIIIENGVYQPDTIKTKSGETLSLRFYRKDPSRCARSIIFSAFNIVEGISLHEAKVITFTPEKPGEYTFNCEMGMYHGKLLVQACASMRDSR